MSLAAVASFMKARALVLDQQHLTGVESGSPYHGHNISHIGLFDHWTLLALVKEGRGRSVAARNAQAVLKSHINFRSAHSQWLNVVTRESTDHRVDLFRSFPRFDNGLDGPSITGHRELGYPGQNLVEAWNARARKIMR